MMPIKSVTTHTSFWRLVSQFSAAKSGIAAIEFALLLPVMLVLYLGCVEITSGVAIQRKVTLTARTVADLASQYTAIGSSDMTNILNAGPDIIVPYSSSPLQAIVSELSINAQGQAVVVWSSAYNGTARTVGSVVTIPTNLATPNSYLILGEAQYSYQPNLGSSLVRNLPLSDTMYMRPRQSTSITFNNS
jgi:Flp pilus assembly protein TadG